MFLERLRASDTVTAVFEYVDAMGLDLSREADAEWLGKVIRESGAQLVVFDSLRRLTPSKAENDSDDMAPIVGAIAKVARDTGAAIILIHHKGDGEKAFRGSTAIRDQADALFLLDGKQHESVRRLTCSANGCKPPRYAEASSDVHLAVSPEDGGVVATEAPPTPARAGREATERSRMKERILSALPSQSKSDVARTCDTQADHGTFKKAWSELERDCLIKQVTGVWQAASESQEVAASLPDAGTVSEEAT